MAKKSQNLFFLPFFENNSSDYENSPKNIIITINGLWVEKMSCHWENISLQPCCLI
jgi:hypothetical protein